MTENYSKMLMSRRKVVA